MHVVQILPLHYSTPSGDRSKVSKDMDFSSSDFHLYGQRFLNNCVTDFNETKCNNYMEGVDNAHCSILNI